MKREEGIILGLIVVVLISIIIGMVNIFFNVSLAHKSTEENVSNETSEKVVKNIAGKVIGSGKSGIAIVKIYGIISLEQDERLSFPVNKGADAVVRRLNKYKTDDSVKAVLLRINSPGGTVGASQEIYNAILELKKVGKKVVVSMGDLAASGGYYIASAADKIYANPGTITGSIGVIMSSLNLSKLLEKYGVKANVIKSGPHKDIGSAYRDMTQEERTILQNLIDSAYEQFLSAVSKGRHIKKSQLRKYADGSVFTGEQAKKIGLVDELGGLREAIQGAWELAGMKGKPRIIKDRFRYWDFLNDLAASFKIKPLIEIKEPISPLMYLFKF